MIAHPTTFNQWVSQKTRPTQFSSAKNAPGKSYEPEVATGGVQGPVQEDSSAGPVEVSSLSDTQ